MARGGHHRPHHHRVHDAGRALRVDLARPARREATARAAAGSAAAYTSTAVVGTIAGAGYLEQVAAHLLTDTAVTVERGPQQVTVRVTATVPSVIPFGHSP